jgi:D-alanyl-lipoteichoic acid acyltransferase DltB (MBOAT superfamily)
MTVSSFLFLVFAALAAIVFHILPTRWKNLWLVLISAGFIATWSWKFVLVLGIFGVVNFFFAKRINPELNSRKRWVAIGIIFNSLSLFLFKYNKFFLPEFENLLKRLGLLQLGVTLQILLPIGLSFLVVQIISYLLDISNKRLSAETNIIKFGVYILYFPKLISGPVERARQFFPHLDSPLPFDRELAERSLAMILTGLFRKIVFANPLFNLIPPDAFLNPSSYSGLNLLFWLLAYAIALYNDFAGYTLIVQGVSLWFGIELIDNFNLPYLSRNIAEFWARWHISLSNWLRDYIYFPLSRALLKRSPERNRVFNLILPPLVTMLVSGMWHGLSWNLLVWGGLHGIYLIVNRIPSFWRFSVPLDEQPRWQQNLGRVGTFIFVILAWVPFRMQLPIAFQYWKGLFQWKLPDLALITSALQGQNTIWSATNLPNPILIFVLAGAIVFDIIQNRQKNNIPVRDWRRVWQIVFIVVLLGITLLEFFSDTTAPFVYQAF